MNQMLFAGKELKTSNFVQIGSGSEQLYDFVLYNGRTRPITTPLGDHPTDSYGPLIISNKNYWP